MAITSAQIKEEGNKELAVKGTSTPISSPTPTKVIIAPSPKPIPTPKKDKTYNVTVKLESVNMTYNNHVGNEWAYGTSIDDKELRPGSSINLSCKDSDKILIQAYVEEQDNIPDYGSQNFLVWVDCLNVCITMEIIVSIYLVLP